MGALIFPNSPTGKWLGFVTSVWVQSISGNDYTFSNYSDVLKSLMALTQLQFNNLYVAKDVGKAIGLLAGFASDCLFTCICNFRKNRGPVLGDLERIYRDEHRHFHKRRVTLVTMPLPLRTQTPCCRCLAKAATLSTMPVPVPISKTWLRSAFGLFFVMMMGGEEEPSPKRKR